LLEQKYYW